MSDPYRQPGERPVYRESQPEPLPTLSGSALDKVGLNLMGITRLPGETDEAFRKRCLTKLHGSRNKT